MKIRLMDECATDEYLRMMTTSKMSLPKAASNLGDLSRSEPELQMKIKACSCPLEKALTLIVVGINACPVLILFFTLHHAVYADLQTESKGVLPNGR